MTAVSVFAESPWPGTARTLAERAGLAMPEEGVAVDADSGAVH